MSIKHIYVVAKATFRNPWRKDETIGTDKPSRVPLDNLCKSYLSDGSLTQVKKPKSSTKKEDK